MTQIEYYKRDNQDENEEIRDEDYANAVIFLRAITQVVKSQVDIPKNKELLA